VVEVVLQLFNGGAGVVGMVSSAGPLCTMGKQSFWYCPQSSRLPLSGGSGVPALMGDRDSPMGRHCGGVLGFCALWEGRPPGTRRLAKCGAWDPLAHVVAGSQC
jgi:hypothetical protein